MPLRVHLVAVLALVLASPRQAPAQTAPPRPSPPPATVSSETRPDFSGTWTLDRSISNDPSKASFDPAQGQSSQRPGGFGGGSRRGRGGAGGGSRPSDPGTANDRTAEEKARLQALTTQLRLGSGTLIISHHEPSFVINDGQDHTLFFQTDDSTNDHQVGTAAVSSTTHWEGPRLVTEYSLSSRLKLVFTYTLLEPTKQMVLRVRVDDTERRRVVSQELKLVYALTTSAPK